MKESLIGTRILGMLGICFPQVNCGRTVYVTLPRIWNYGITRRIIGTLKTSGRLEDSIQSNPPWFSDFPRSGFPLIE